MLQFLVLKLFSLAGTLSVLRLCLLCEISYFNPRKSYRLLHLHREIISPALAECKKNRSTEYILYRVFFWRLLHCFILSKTQISALRDHKDLANSRRWKKGGKKLICTAQQSRVSLYHANYARRWGWVNSRGWFFFNFPDSDSLDERLNLTRTRAPHERTAKLRRGGINSYTSERNYARGRHDNT